MKADTIHVFEADAVFEGNFFKIHFLQLRNLQYLGFPKTISKVSYSSQTCLNYFSFLLIITCVVLINVIIAVNVIYLLKKRKQIGSK